MLKISIIEIHINNSWVELELEKYFGIWNWNSKYFGKNWNSIFCEKGIGIDKKELNACLITSDTISIYTSFTMIYPQLT